MATDTNLVQGEVSEKASNDELDIEKLMIGFLRTLIQEQKAEK